MTQVTAKHRFAVPPERVYDAWLDPVTVRRFLFTTATGEIVRCDLDPRPGGRYAIVDRRDGEDILHEGTYLELDRGRRLQFTLRVPKYSQDEDRVTLLLEPATGGCELTLTTDTDEKWADDTRRGWAMILDVLGELLPAETPTCGGGLAQHASVPRRMALYLGELAETLALHRATLVAEDPRSKDEDAVYRELAASVRDVAGRLRDVAERMTAQRELPMGKHDDGKAKGEQAKAFARFVHEQGALTSVLRIASERDEKMLNSQQNG
jgi:uncharacterized protein YndB with AHSA1/START domain